MMEKVYVALDEDDGIIGIFSTEKEAEKYDLFPEEYTIDDIPKQYKKIKYYKCSIALIDYYKNKGYQNHRIILKGDLFDIGTIEIEELTNEIKKYFEYLTVYSKISLYDAKERATQEYNKIN